MSNITIMGGIFEWGFEKLGFDNVFLDYATIGNGGTVRKNSFDPIVTLFELFISGWVLSLKGIFFCL